MATFAVVGFFAGASAVASGSQVGSAPLPTKDSLYGVSCATATTCFAVGGSDSAGARTARTLIERWNGQGWAKVASPNAAGKPSSFLRGVSCTSAINCFAVGDAGAYGARVPRSLVEHWNGKTWSIVTSPGAGPLTGVSCTSATSCFAVGGSVLRWDGKTWTILESPAVYVVSVSCTSALSCMAVGDTGSAHWNGKAWSKLPTPQGDPNQFEGFPLNGVSCTSATSCIAVGADSVPLDDFSLLSERWNGKTWSKLPTPDPNHFGYFNGVSCTSATSCLAVSGGDPNRPRAFVGRWDGKAWSDSASPTFGVGASWLSAVSCSSATNCLAVGYLGRPYFGDQHALIEHWDGITWSVAGPSAGGAS